MNDVGKSFGEACIVLLARVGTVLLPVVGATAFMGAVAAVGWMLDAVCR